MKYLGWDWASQTHDVTVLDHAGSVLERWAFPHTEACWAATIHRLRRHGDPDELPVIIERTSAPVVDRLLEAGHPVVPVHPTAFYATRPRWSASGAKSDPGDSYKLADYLRTDGHRLRRLEPVEPGLRELQVLVRLRDDQVRTRTATVNQLTATLDAHWPGPRKLFQSLAPQITLAFLTDYPTPNAAAHLGEARMAAFCRRHSYRGAKPATELLERLRAAPIAPVGLPADTLSAIVGAQVALLRSTQWTITDTEKLIAARLAEHPRAQLLAQLPGVDMINLAQLLAEVGPILDRVESAEQAATECGAAPLFRSVGKGESARLGDTRLTTRSVTRILTRAAARAGISVDQISARSLRRGFATSAYAAGVPERELMRTGRWRSVSIARRYDASTRWAEPASARLGI